MKKSLFTSLSLFILIVTNCFLNTANAQNCSQLSIGLGISNTNPCLNTSTSFWKLGDWQLQNNVKWFVDNVQVGTGSNLNYTFTTSGSHVVKIQGSTSDNSCTKSNTITVNVPTNVGAVSGLTTVNAGQIGVVYSVPSMGNGTYNWNTTTDAQIISGQGSNSITVNFGNGIGSSFQIVAQYTSAGGCTSTSSLTVQKGTVIDCNSLNLGIGVSTQPPCLGQNTSFWMTGSSTLQSNLTWYINNVQVGTGQNMNYTFASAGTYSIKLVGKTTGNTCTKENTTSVTILPTVGPISGATTVSPNSNQTYTVPNMGAGTYNWWHTTDAQITSGQNSSSATYHFGNSITNSFTVNVGYTSTNGCYTERSLAVNKVEPCINKTQPAQISRNEIVLFASQNVNPICSIVTEDITIDTAVFQIPAFIKLSRVAQMSDVAYLVVSDGNVVDTLVYKLSTGNLRLESDSTLPFFSSSQNKIIGAFMYAHSFHFFFSGISNSDIKSSLKLSMIVPLSNEFAFNQKQSLRPCVEKTITINYQNTSETILANTILEWRPGQYVDIIPNSFSGDFTYISKTNNTYRFSLKYPLSKSTIASFSYRAKGKCGLLNTGDKQQEDTLRLGTDENKIHYAVIAPQLALPKLLQPSNLGNSQAFASTSVLRNISDSSFSGKIYLKYKRPTGYSTFTGSYLLKPQNSKTEVVVTRFVTFSDTVARLEAEVRNLNKGDTLGIEFLSNTISCLPNNITVTNILEISFGCPSDASACTKAYTDSKNTTLSPNAEVALIGVSTPTIRPLGCDNTQKFTTWEMRYVVTKGTAIDMAFLPGLGASDFSVVPFTNGMSLEVRPLRGSGRTSSSYTIREKKNKKSGLGLSRKRKDGFPCVSAVGDSLIYNGGLGGTIVLDSLSSMRLDKLYQFDTAVFRLRVYTCCPNLRAQYDFPNSNDNLLVNHFRVSTLYKATNCTNSYTELFNNNNPNPPGGLLPNHDGYGILGDIKTLKSPFNIPAYNTFTIKFNANYLDLWKDWYTAKGSNTSKLQSERFSKGRLIMQTKFSKAVGWMENNQTFIETSSGHKLYPNKKYGRHKNITVVKPSDVEEVFDVWDSVRFDFNFANMVKLPNTDNSTDLLDSLMRFPSKFNFQYQSFCPKGGTVGSSTLDYALYFQPDTNCATCIIPLMDPFGEIRAVNCPGCKVPGTVMNYFTLGRSTIGFQDSDNNGLPDHVPPLKADPATIETKKLLFGDTLQMTGGITMNSDVLTTNRLGFDLPYLYMDAQFDGGDILDIISYKAELFNNSTSLGQYTLSKNAVPTLTEGTKRHFFFDFSVDTLAKHGILLPNGKYTEPINVRYSATFRVARNPITYRPEQQVLIEPVFTGKRLNLAQMASILTKYKDSTIYFRNRFPADSLHPKKTDSTRFFLCQLTDDILHYAGYTTSLTIGSSVPTLDCENALVVNYEIKYNSKSPDDIFSNEFRSLPVPDSILVEWPIAKQHITGGFVQVVTDNNVKIERTMTQNQWREIDSNHVILYPRSRQFSFQTTPSTSTPLFPFLENKLAFNTSLYVGTGACNQATLPNITKVNASADVRNNLNESINFNRTVNGKLTLYRVKSNMKLKEQVQTITVNDDSYCFDRIANPISPVWRAWNDTAYIDHDVAKLGTNDTVRFFNANHPFYYLQNKAGQMLIASAMGGTVEASGIVNGSRFGNLLNVNGTWKADTTDFKMCFKYNDCRTVAKTANDTLTLTYGWACERTLNTSQCFGQRKTAKIIAQIQYPNLLAGLITGQNSLASCDTNVYTFPLSNTGSGRMPKAEWLIKLNDPALSISKATITMQHHNRARTSTITIAPTTIVVRPAVNGTYTFSTLALLTDTVNRGVQNATLKVEVRASCETPNRTNDILYTMLGTSFCGKKDTLSNNIPVKLIAPFTDSLKVTILPDTIRNCSTAPKQLKVKVINTAKKATQNSNKLTFTAFNTNYTATLNKLAATHDTTVFFTVQPPIIPTSGATYPLTAQLISSKAPSICNGASCTRRDTIRSMGSLVAMSCNSLPPCVVASGLTFSSKTAMPAILGNETDSTFITGGGVFDGTYLVLGHLVLKDGDYRVLPGTVFNVYATENLHPIIIVKYGTIKIDSSIFQSPCDEMWSGLVVYNGGEINLYNSTIKDAILGLHLTTATQYITDPALGGIDYDITGNVFMNNNRSMFGEALLSKDNNTYKNITGNLFTSSIGGLKKPFETGIPEQHLVFFDNGSKVNISGNTFEYALYGVSIQNISFRMENNIFRYIPGLPASIEARRDLYFKGNTIDMASTTNDPEYVTPAYLGIQFSGHIANRPTMNFHIDGNTLLGKDGAEQIGLFQSNGRLNLDHYVENNQFKNLDLGIWDDLTNENVLQPPTYNYVNNQFVNCRTALQFEGGNAGDVKREVTCNTFTNALGGQGIVHNGVVALPDLGTASDPNGNKFTGYTTTGTFGVLNNHNESFSYFVNSAEPNFNVSQGVTKTQTPNLPNCSSKGYPNGNFRQGDIEEEEIAWKMDSLRVRNGNSEQLQAYEKDILHYYQDNKDLVGLEKYAQSIVNCNRGAYYRICFYLHNSYEEMGDSLAVQDCEQALLLPNPDHAYIKAYLTWHGYKKRNQSKAFAPFWKPSKADSLLLLDLANSNTSFALEACLTLKKAYRGYLCQYSRANAVPLDIIVNNCNPQYQYRQGEGVEEENTRFENKVWLGKAAPNPAMSQTVINYNIPKNAGMATLRVISLETGVVVEEISLEEGERYITYLTIKLETGVYAYTLIVNGNPVDTQKLVILK